MTVTRLSVLVTAALSLTLLSACAGPQSLSAGDPTGSSPTATASATSSPTPPASASPSPTGSATAAPAAVITTAGWGDLKLGKPVPSSTTLVAWKTVDPDQCMGNTGYWDIPTDPNAVLVRTKGNSRTGVIQGISLLDPSVTTKSGAHVGTSLADLKKLFPSIKPDSSGNLYVVSDSAGQVVFDVGDKNADEYYPGPAAKQVVLVLHVLPTSTKPFSNQNTEFGPCA